MTVEEAIKFIYSFKDWERGARYKFDLNSFRQFVEKIGSPHSRLKHPILIAGTKGKGSTANILASVLQLAGKTGLYTSPHIVDIRERIKINDTPIPEADFVNIIEDLKPYITPERSTFEILTAIAFVYFAKENVDFAIFEVGIGGRLDATNVIEPEVSVLTPISFDHTEILGNTLTSIATEKCGIIREHGKLVSAPQPPEVMELIKDLCMAKHTKLWTVGEDLFCEDVTLDFNGTQFNIGEEKYFLPLLGRHQVINALTAICTAWVCEISSNMIREGISKSKSPGRLQVISRDPWLIFDGAHNVASAWVLRKTIVELFNFRHLFLILGILKDKDKHGMIEVLAPITNYAFVTPLKSERSSDPRELLEIFKHQGVKTKIVKNPLIGLKETQKLATSGDLILATGSLYLVGELLSSLKL